MKTLISSDTDNEEDGKPNPDDGRDIAHYTPEGVCALSREGTGTLSLAERRAAQDARKKCSLRCPICEGAPSRTPEQGLPAPHPGTV